MNYTNISQFLFLWLEIVNRESFTTVHFTYLCIKIELAVDNEMEAREKLRSILDSLEVL